MRRSATVSIAIAALLMPLLAAFGHAEAELAPPLHDREIVVTGHDELDPALHIERASGVVVIHCPDCVLDKRQSAARLAAGPMVRAHAIGRDLVVEVHNRRHAEPLAGLAPRAPPAA